MTTILSIVIPAYERADSLRQTLSVLSEQIDECTEVLVIDDHSSTDSIAEACKDFAFVEYYRTECNLGVIGARNFGYTLTTGHIIINLDDDSFPANVNFLDQVRDLFSLNDIGIAAFNIDQEQVKRWHPQRDRFDTYTYTGCGNAWSRQLYTQVGGFSPLFWRQGEELEHSMRAIEAGFRILAVPDIIVTHVPSQINRWPKRHQALELSNYLKRILMRIPLWALPEYIARFLVLLLIRWGRFDYSTLISDLRSERGLSSAVAHRHPMSLQTFRRWKALRDASK